MRTSLEWIKDQWCRNLSCTAQEYMDAMTLSGSKVEGYEKLDADLEKIVVGQIEKIEKHPDADKLVVCQVNVGQENNIQIVTGATKCKRRRAKCRLFWTADVWPAVMMEKRLRAAVKIKKGKLRGVESYGMMCSIEELGSTTDMYPDAPEYGIYISPGRCSRLEQMQ